MEYMLDEIKHRCLCLAQDLIKEGSKPTKEDMDITEKLMGIANVIETINIYRMESRGNYGRELDKRGVRASIGIAGPPEELVFPELWEKLIDSPKMDEGTGGVQMRCIWHVFKLIKKDVLPTLEEIDIAKGFIDIIVTLEKQDIDRAYDVRIVEQDYGPVKRPIPVSGEESEKLLI